MQELLKKYSLYTSLETNLSVSLIKSYLFILLTIIFDTKQKNSVNEHSEKKDQAANEIIKFIDLHYTETITLDLLAQQFHLNKYYICRIFKDNTGFNLSEYVQHRRIIEAKKLLIHSDKSIDYISIQCGFKNMQHFYRVFKKITKHTPYHFKKAYGGK